MALLLAQLVRDQAWTAFATIVTTAISEQGLPPALEGAQAGANLAAGAEQACTSGMRLADQLNGLEPVSGAGQPSASSKQKASHFFSKHQQGRHLRHDLLFALQLQIESLDLSLVLGTELLELLLLLRLGELVGQRLQGQHRLLVGILGGLTPTFHLLRVQHPLTAIGTEFSGVLLRKPTATAQQTRAPP